MGAVALIDFRSFVKDVPDFPKAGIIFKDITPLLADHKAFQAAISAMAAPFKGRGIELVAGIESRGFLFAASIAGRLSAGVIPIRKKGKLPRKTLCAAYGLEYGIDTLEIHEDAAAKSAVVLVVDDVLATGGTAKASCELIEKVGAKVAGVSFLIELGFLKGREKLAGRDVRAVLSY
ncbi:MAG: adenine phosphoribosyltransferase [Elusimicrobia bacterium]|nr:adenine phosphoribosyltransferase [Elusimicrobiota bacterium]